MKKQIKSIKAAVLNGDVYRWAVLQMNHRLFVNTTDDTDTHLFVLYNEPN